MENLDAKIDTLSRNKLISLIQENAVRVSKLNIRYTKQNQKNSLEHLENLYASFDRLLRSVIKEILHIEKKVRLNYLVPLAPERKVRILSALHKELEFAVEKMAKQYREFYTRLRKQEEFDNRLEETLRGYKEKLESQMEKLFETLGSEIGSSSKIQPREIGEKYGWEETFLREMNCIQPIQDIHLNFDRLMQNGSPEEIFDGVHEAISLCVQTLKNLENQIPASHLVKERKGWKMAVAKDSVALKDFVVNIKVLGDQALLQQERRNTEIIQKTWDRVQEYLREKPEPDAVLAKVNPFYQLLSQ